MTDETNDPNPIKTPEIKQAQKITSARQIRNGLIFDYHFGQQNVSAGTVTPDYVWEIKLNGKTYQIPLKEK